jgi:nicotinamide mononucleotide transporter
MNFFDQQSIFFTLLDYPMSYLEFFGTIAGAIAVWLSARAHVWSWPIGIINVILLFFLFFQIQLYPDMFLQIFFFITNILGWWRWTHPKVGEEDRKNELRISRMSPFLLGWTVVLVIAGTIGSGLLAGNLHVWLPFIFSQKSAFPFADSFVTVLSILAQYWMLHKKVECWAMWIVADVVATYLYFLKEVKFLGLEYLVFCFIAGMGFYNWWKEYNSYKGDRSLI